MTIDELVAENIRRARVAMGLSTHELARRVTGIGLPTAASALRRLEAGQDSVSVSQLVAIALALGMPPALLAPLNASSVQWVDAQGHPPASWALFHEWALSLSTPEPEEDPQEAPLALEVPAEPGSPGGPPTPREAVSAEVPPPSEPPEPPPADEVTNPPAPPPPSDQTRPAAVPDSGAAANQEPPTPPAEAPPRPKMSPGGGNGSLTPQDRSWALTELQMLERLGRES